jgi:AcrR family transcriptional regulator
LAELESRTLRADATRNRDQLIAVATRVLMSADAEPSMRAIAREAGVGIATLYRHFPTRESLVDAVYRDQVSRLTAGARELLAQLERGRTSVVTGSGVVSCPAGGQACGGHPDFRFSHSSGPGGRHPGG